MDSSTTSSRKRRRLRHNILQHYHDVENSPLFRPRRFLAVPNTVEELVQTEDAFLDRDPDEDNDHDIEVGDDALAGTAAAATTTEDGSVDTDPWQEVALSVTSDTMSRTYHHGRRPLPSTQVLLTSHQTSEHEQITASLSSFQPLRSPLMMKFYESVGVIDLSVVGDEMDDLSKDHNTEETTVEDDIDNPAFSTLRAGHHDRYLQLMGASQRQQQHQRPAQQKEFQTLQKQVMEEQKRYRKALERYYVQHQSRYLLGFQQQVTINKDDDHHQSSKQRLQSYSQWACTNAKIINEHWKREMITANAKDQQQPPLHGRRRRPLPRLYGKTRQIISLPNTMTTSTSSTSSKSQVWLNVQDLVFQTVDLPDDGDNKTPMSDSSHMSATRYPLAIGTTLPPPPPPPRQQQITSLSSTLTLASFNVLLRNDSIALQLAQQHSCRIVTTMETLQELLRLPGQFSTHWIVPATQQQKQLQHQQQGHDHNTNEISILTILDRPVARPFASPRDCLEGGFEEALYQVCKRNGEEKEETEDRAGVVLYQYRVWALPAIPGTSRATSRHDRTVRILIRAPVRLVDPVTQQPIVLRAHIEYFADQGRPKETPNSYERALWILDHVLFRDQAFQSQFVRINPMDGKVVGWDATSIAQALSSNGSLGTQNKMPLIHWQNMIQLLHAIPTMDVEDGLLCLPGRRTKGPASGNGTNAIRLDPFAVTIHGPFDTTRSQKAASNKEEPTIDLEAALDEAGAVMLGDAALKECRRAFEWNRPDQIPWTFPVQRKK